MACDTQLELTNVALSLQQALGVPATARATFVRLEVGPHHDGVRFANGAEITMQRLGPGVSAVLVEEPRLESKIGTPRLAEVE
jgi:hypothetical protein